MSSDSSESPENICVVCFKNVEIYSIGGCDHMVCYECSTRMRVLCRQNECPICRQELPRVIFTSVVKPFSEIQNCSTLEDRKFKICFQNKKIQDEFFKLLEHRCLVCPMGQSFRSFQNLNDHMVKEHNLYYCDLCVEHLKIFTSERQCYTRKNLEQHKKKGDADDRSHRGHPLCEFCDVRYMDNDCLYRHLRRDHLYCHFCDADGFDLYYSSYDYLLEHFRTEHYLCEEGSCVDEKFTPVFRTDIDLKAHRASAHGRTLGKAAAKQARTLELEFTLKRRPRNTRDRPGHNDASSSEGAVGGLLEQPTPQTNLPKLDSSDFPSLPPGPGSSAPVIPQRQGRSGALTIHTVGRRNTSLAINDENFPLLGVYNDSSVPGTSVRLNISRERNGAERSGSRASRNVSIRVNHRPNGEQNISIRQDDFPALTSEKKSQPGTAMTNWAVISSKKTSSPPAAKPAKQSLQENDFPSLHSKFSTNLNLKVNEGPKPNFVNVRTKVEESKGKKASSVTISMQSESSEPAESSGTSSSSSSKTKSKKNKSKGNNLEEKSDTAKKKSPVKEVETMDSRHQKSALTVTTSETELGGKPLPKVEDWFEGLKKVKKGENEVSGDNTEVSSNFSFKDFSLVMESTFGGCNANNNNNNNNIDEGKREVSKKGEPKAPPGFDTFNGCFNNNDARKPPPGFEVDFPRTNGLTFTNSSGQSFAISTDFQYLPPVDFEKRNQNLVSRVNKIITDDANLKLFKKMSVLFRQDLVSANVYFKHCVTAMGDEGLREIFPELLVLLPDVRKQQELLTLYNTTCKEGSCLKSCTTCYQVLSSEDLSQHAAHHSMQHNFPVLMGDQCTQ